MGDTEEAGGGAGAVYSSIRVQTHRYSRIKVYKHTWYCKHKTGTGSFMVKVSKRLNSKTPKNHSTFPKWSPLASTRCSYLQCLRNMQPSMRKV